MTDADPYDWKMTTHAEPGGEIPAPNFAELKAFVDEWDRRNAETAAEELAMAVAPEPERRKLTFGEAWKEAAAGKSVPYAKVPFGPDEDLVEMVSVEPGRIRFRFAEESGGGWIDPPPAVLADVTWEARAAEREAAQ